MTMNLSLLDAFAKFGAKPRNRQRALSALAVDGALVLNCSPACFGHPSPGVLRYEDRLSRDAAAKNEIDLLSQHLTLARDGPLPVRMVVATAVDSKSRARGFHVRSDLVGAVVKFDGDHFIIDFTRPLQEPLAAAVRPKRAAPSGRATSTSQ
jgi:hypothetical protein